MVAVDERRSAVIAGVGLGALTTLIIGLGGLQAAAWLVFIGGAWLAAVFRRRRVGAEGQEILLDYPIDPVVHA